MDSKQHKLLYGGAYSIKDYYMESGNPRQMRGASELLNECVACIEKLLKNNGVTEDDIIANCESQSSA